MGREKGTDPTLIALPRTGELKHFKEKNEAISHLETPKCWPTPKTEMEVLELKAHVLQMT